MPVPLDYASAGSKPRRRLPAALVVFLSVASLYGIGALALPRMNRRACEYPIRLKCASNLRQIGQGCYMYAHENRGAFPDDVAALILTQDLTSEVFVCYHTTDTRAEGPTTQAVASALTSGGYLSYAYLGKGMSLSSPTTAIIAYEPLANHGDGMHVLFADGTVDWITPAQATKLMAELQTGFNPPRPEKLKQQFDFGSIGAADAEVAEVRPAL